MNLLQLDASAWSELENAAVNPDSGFRQVNLCSVNTSMRPQARMVVLRRADERSRLLEFHTDVRSRKWREIRFNPFTTILGFCGKSRLQLRLQGMAELHGPGSEQADRAWDQLSRWTRSTYAGGPPGDVLSDETPSPPNATVESGGKSVFGVITFRAEALDWFRLGRENNRRAEFIYNDAGELVTSRWINP
ncbi:pyridoxamine 5'-phosphate oxidase [Ensifer sp. Root31]|uniref:pyridoxamine 5'-phosphate oxidase family protein n=1 Tax=Ensifer sp. Root31 TaxID=1736512 RepID=UPI00070B2DAF|nr:pyridoxamine 5'-phosphate oxidase family protein [Ensifer sp. Root31]KQU86362.1 pyridoxamine 5'-phosphate oxidase [Ensifer sp. Root31]